MTTDATINRRPRAVPNDGLARNIAGKRTQGTCVECYESPATIVGYDRCGRCYRFYCARLHGKTR